MATAAERARIDKLVRDNAGLAIEACEPYLGRGLEIEDIAQAAMLGLTRAAARFDDRHESGATFATYASRWIRAEIMAEVRRSRAIPVGERLARSGAEWPRIGRLAEPDRVIDPASIADPHAVTDDEVAIEAALRRLRPPERRALELRFGLLDGRERTMEQVGKRLGLSRQAATVRVARGLQLLMAELRSNRTGKPDLRLAFA
jgi:RNA polymerase sigma factor (sigma-70 family)